MQREGEMRAVQIWVDRVADKEKTPQWYAWDGNQRELELTCCKAALNPEQQLDMYSRKDHAKWLSDSVF